MARIATMSYKGHCSADSCDTWGTYPNGKPTKMFGASLMNFISHLDQNNPGHETLFKEVFKNNKVRILKVLDVSQESKEWAADPKNRLCDAGGWFCPGQYPPKLRALFDDTLAKGNPEAERYRDAYTSRLEEQKQELPKPNGEGIPDGSYLESCKGCSLEQDGERKLLKCTHCQQPTGPVLGSEIDPRSCRSGMFDNIAGELQCKPMPNSPDIPKGPYAQSCGGCTLEMENLHRPWDAVVKCTHCGKANGRRQSSSYRMSRCPVPGFLDNQDGTLTCENLPSHWGEVPDGAYRGSCAGCKREARNGEPWVACSHCKKSNREQVEAAIRFKECTPPDWTIDNQDGQLKCKRVR
eukprot:gnl/TRDRNA2_/TRDRNA2_165055_c1_seq1.p1 gnl/TRDRNA2_/TRDRNA2_165055_c1~~gnl/TRDRNA2_/TRDRNA2_165055_c1_seq1.p1  ORF type:complete len:412 (+),score=53.20 gnl/TRDRNA2_/TRDRNA2_165055_c1_seq1:181-1236(+)